MTGIAGNGTAEELLPEEKTMSAKKKIGRRRDAKTMETVADDPIKSKIKKRIWQNIQHRCDGKSKALVHIELWHPLVAAVAILLIIGGLLFLSVQDEMGGEKNIK